MNDRTKLPKWAQHEMARLEDSANYHKRRLMESIGESERGTDTAIHLGYNQTPVGLPNGTVIRFETENGTIEARVESGDLMLSAYQGSLSIRPIVSNAVRAGVVPR